MDTSQLRYQHRAMRRNTFVLFTVWAVLMLAFSPVGAAMALAPVVDLAANQQNLVVRGAQANEYLTEMTGEGDFNGDGINDMLLGAAGNNSQANLSGAAYMILGKPNLPAAMDLSTAKADFTIYGAGVNHVLGRGMDGCDVNGDGTDDMVIGADGVGNAKGAVYVILGGATKFNTKPVVVPGKSGDQPELVINGSASGGRFGRSLACGNVNGDAFADIVVGAYYASPGGKTQAGSVYLFLGSNTISEGGTVTWTPADADLTINGAAGSNALLSPLAVDAEAASAQAFYEDINDSLAPTAGIGDRIGRSVALGDINGDGREDIIAGAYGADVSGNVDAGQTLVFFGQTSYTGQTINLDTAGAGSSLVFSGVAANDQAGFYVAAGNFNNSGNEDLLISAYYKNNQTGEVYVVEGAGAVSGSLATPTARIIGSATGDRLGRSLAVGKINGDAIDDLIIGASRADPSGRSDAGIVYVIFGKANLTGAIQLTASSGADMQILGAQAGSQPCPDEVADPSHDCSDEAGHSVASGDFNGDGADDVLVGAIYANNGTLQDAGAAYMVNGEPSAQSLFLPIVRK